MYRKSYCTTSGVGDSKMLKFLHLKLLGDGQATVKGAILKWTGLVAIVLVLFV